MARARIRTVKPEMLDDEKVAALPHLAWRLFVSLIMTSDDYGNQHGAVAKIRGTALWATDATDGDIREALARLSRDSLVALYEVRGQAYVAICGWSKHQKVDKPGKPIVPGPEQADPQPCGIRENLARDSREPRESLAPDQDQERDLEGKGKTHTPRARDRVVELADRLHAAHAAEARRLADSIPGCEAVSVGGGPLVEPTAGAIRGVVTRWLEEAAAIDVEREPYVEAQLAKLVAVRSATARRVGHVKWWAASTFWAWDGIEKDLAQTPKQAADSQRPGHGARDSPARHQSAPDRPLRGAAAARAIAQRLESEEQSR